MSRNNYSGQLRQKGSDLATDILGIGSVLKEATTDKMHSLKDTAAAKLAALRNGATSMGRNTRDAVGRTVAKSPWKSMLIAAGAGAVIGWFIHRRR